MVDLDDVLVDDVGWQGIPYYWFYRTELGLSHADAVEATLSVLTAMGVIPDFTEREVE